MSRPPHTYAILEVAPEAYAEIRAKLEAAGYSDQFHHEDDAECIDMHGIAVRASGPKRETWHCFGCGAGGMQGNFCEQCGAGKKDYEANQP